ncbi:MAG: hypothetical protein V3T84_05830 [Phycisphaerales bacterium]
MGADAAARDVIQLAIKALIERSIPKMQEHAQLAARYGLDLITYEGGQHILPQPAGTTPPFSQAMWDAQRDSSMYEAYETLLESFRQMDGRLFVAFNFAAAKVRPGARGAIWPTSPNPSPTPRSTARWQTTLKRPPLPPDAKHSFEPKRAATGSSRAGENGATPPNWSDGQVSDKVFSPNICEYVEQDRRLM